MYKVGEPVACIGIINHFEGNDYWTSIECKNGLKVLCQTRDLIPSPIAKIQERLQFLKDVDEQCPEIKLSTDDAKIQELEMVLKWLGEE